MGAAAQTARGANRHAARRALHALGTRCRRFADQGHRWSIRTALSPCRYPRDPGPRGGLHERAGGVGALLCGALRRRQRQPRARRAARGGAGGVGGGPTKLWTRGNGGRTVGSRGLGAKEGTATGGARRHTIFPASVRKIRPSRSSRCSHPQLLLGDKDALLNAIHVGGGMGGGRRHGTLRHGPAHVCRPRACRRAPMGTPSRAPQRPPLRHPTTHGWRASTALRTAWWVRIPWERV
jgi:hypothetical protein